MPLPASILAGSLPSFPAPVFTAALARQPIKWVQARSGADGRIQDAPSSHCGSLSHRRVLCAVKWALANIHSALIREGWTRNSSALHPSMPQPADDSSVNSSTTCLMPTCSG
jgi:hypothetical protein